MGIFRRCSRAALDAYYCFLSNDGWATASHIALSTLMALFQFIILVTALAASFHGPVLKVSEDGFLTMYLAGRRVWEL